MRNLMLFFIAILFSSCATIYTGTKQVIYFDTNDSEADIYLNKEKIGTGPFVYEAKRKSKKQTIEYRENKVKTSSTSLTKQFKYISLLSNIYIPVDLLSGAAYKYDEEYIYPVKRNKNKSETRKGSFYVVKNNGDTIYAAPDFKWKGSNLAFTDLYKKKQSLSCEDVDSYYDFSTGWNGIFYGFFSLKFSNYYTMDKYSVIPIDTTKRKIIYTQYKEIAQNKKYKILQDTYSISHYSATNGFTSSTRYKYYLFDGKEKLDEIKDKNCLSTVKKHFSNCPELIAMLEKKSKTKVFRKYYKEKYEK